MADVSFVADACEDAFAGLQVGDVPVVLPQGGIDRYVVDLVAQSSAEQYFETVFLVEVFFDGNIYFVVIKQVEGIGFVYGK